MTDDVIAEAVSASDIADPLNIPDLKATMAPFLFDSIDDINTLTQSDWFAALADRAASQGVKIVAANLINGERYFITKKPVAEPADMKGMKIRVPNNTNYINTLQLLAVRRRRWLLQKSIPLCRRALLMVWSTRSLTALQTGIMKLRNIFPIRTT